MTKVRKAVIPAAGLGTRFLPATKAVPKEMIPVVDRPTIQYVVEEAANAGIDDVLLILGRGKGSIAGHFDRSPELEAALEAGGKTEVLDEVIAVANLARVYSVRQGAALGLGHAVGMAEGHVGNEPFAVMLGDDVMVDDSALLRGMVRAAEEHGCSVVALMEVPHEEISLYGCASVDENLPSIEEQPLVPVSHLVEKPSPDQAPSNLAVIGRYVFQPEIFSVIANTKPGVGGEIQLTDAIDELARDGRVMGYRFRDGRYDIGKKEDFLRATVELALAREDLGPDFAEYLRNLVLTRWT